jgi:hypothetical protein
MLPGSTTAARRGTLLHELNDLLLQWRLLRPFSPFAASGRYPPVRLPISQPNLLQLLSSSKREVPVGVTCSGLQRGRGAYYAFC